MKLITTTIIAIFFSIQSFGQCLETEQAYKDYFKNNIASLNQIEGIWSISYSGKLYSESELVSTTAKSQSTFIAIIKTGSSFRICRWNGSNDEAITEFAPTANPNIYLYKKNYLGEITTANAVITNIGILEYSYEEGKNQLKKKMGDSYTDGLRSFMDFKFIKTFPTLESEQQNQKSSGTGFAISSDGFIATNHHVVNGATNITVRGIKGDFSKTYKAKVIVEDKNNDLAIIKIDEAGFSSLGTIPFVIPNKSCDVGCSVFCLGYPLRATMGDEVKLTNGIISSKSGFQGDVTTYQITNPVQPGNSGGPLFDNKGNLIGIINAKHLGAENVSYAIKTAYLSNLIDIMPTAPKLQTISTLSGKSLAEQVKIIKNFTYIIEVN